MSSLYINEPDMGMRKKVRTKWKAKRKEQIRKVSQKRRKKALKRAEKKKQAA